MFFYGYRCYMKKHDITNNILNIPSYDDEDGVVLGNGSTTRDDSTVGDESTTNDHGT